MKTRSFLISVFCLLISLATYANPKEKTPIVLVPGIINSLMPGGYYSKVVVNTLRKNNIDLLVVKGLSPFASFEENGERVAQQILAWQRSRKSHQPISIIAHSSGGFYSLEAINKYQELSIKNLIFMGTPLKGSRVADFLLQSKILSLVVEMTGALPFDLLNFKGLYQLKTKAVKDFIKGLDIKEKINFYSVAGVQKASFFGAYNAKNLNPIYGLLSQLLVGEGDGVVSVSSAFGEGVQFSPQSLASVQPILTTALDHTEQHYHAKILSLMGIFNTGYVSRGQARLYTDLANIIKSTY